MRFMWRSSLFLGAICAVALVCCGDETCEVKGEKGPWDEYIQANLPTGKCDRFASCTLFTQDSCPAGGPGPHITWRCSCVRDEWTCREVDRASAACVPPVTKSRNTPAPITEQRSNLPPASRQGSHSCQPLPG